MISSLPCSSVTENATCTGSSGEFCLVKWTSFTLRVSCSCDCSGILSLLVPRWDRLRSYGVTRADSTGQSGRENCGNREFQKYFSLECVNCGRFFRRGVQEH